MKRQLEEWEKYLKITHPTEDLYPKYMRNNNKKI